MKRMFLAALLPCLIPMQALATDERPNVNFTGPLLTPNARNLPPGVVMVQPYLIYGSSHSAYDAHGERRKKPEGSHLWQTVVPVIVGITPRFQAQMNLGAARVSSAGNTSDGLRMGDTTLRLQYMLVAPNADGTHPAVGVTYSHRFATGAYDRLEQNPLNGVGNGAEVDTLTLLTQHFVWFGNNRPLRWRTRVAYSPAPSRVGLRGSSVYGTNKDFRGHAQLGRSLGLAGAAEYSIDEHWVLAMDLAYDREEVSWVRGVQRLPSGAIEAVSRRDPARSVYSVAPAVEYNFNGNYGVIAGVHYSLAGRNNSSFVQPQVSFMMIF